MWDGCISGAIVKNWNGLSFFLDIGFIYRNGNWKGILNNPGFLTAWIKGALLWKLSTVLKIILKILGIVSESGFVLQFIEATMNLAPMGVLCVLGNQYIMFRQAWI